MFEKEEMIGFFIFTMPLWAILLWAIVSVINPYFQ